MILVLLVVFTLLYFTLTYQTVLLIITLFILYAGITLTNTRTFFNKSSNSKANLKIKLKNKVNKLFTQQSIMQFIVAKNGECQFLEHKYQLLSSSRVSFFGCWLKMILIRNGHQSNQSLQNIKHYFIYRDSLSNQDFSRLARVIKSLKY